MILGTRKETMKAKPMTKASHATAIFRLIAAAVACFAFFYAVAHPSAQTPNLIVTAVPAGNTGQAPTLTVTSDSQATWKAFVITAGTVGNYQVLWAESNGTTGGIYTGAITTSTSSLTNPAVPPAPSVDLPLEALTKNVNASVAGVDPAIVATAANSYEALARQIDQKTIASPLQLQVVTGTQLLASFNSDQIAALKVFNTSVAGWIDAQQCVGKLRADKMDGYAAAYHAIAKALQPGTVTAKPATVTVAPPKPTAAPPCKNGQCPASGPSRFRIFSR